MSTENQSVFGEVMELIGLFFGAPSV